MSISFLETKLKRLHRELNTLESQRASAMKDEANALKKVNNANSSISKTKNSSTINSKLREIDRENKKIQKAKEKQSDLLNKINKKNTEINNTSLELSKNRQKEQEKAFELQEMRIREYENQQQTLLSNATVQNELLPEQEESKEYDVFISHSADDKDDFVEELANLLNESGIKTWYDSNDIPWGGSIRQEIDKGLSSSRYGIVVISPSFIKKYWTNYELDGILSKQSSTGEQMILPIWHNVTADIVKEYSPSISNINALNSAFITKSEIVENLKKLLK
ncbi:toll/interleukin-1 receptor domain-containing protein [Bacillus sp. JCM 19034]|uniref:toll/interleukin-1 receptor domain-containing protein n=1 Tax=Bacillus sp. JCM 19034 TaxID=1481928 RepID=UPI000780CF38|nr:toll/interleukin-1 receptor domain-containing protein [Bacillus sp. JCM 19034]